MCFRCCTGRSWQIERTVSHTKSTERASFWNTHLGACRRRTPRAAMGLGQHRTDADEMHCQVPSDHSPSVFTVGMLRDFRQKKRSRRSGHDVRSLHVYDGVIMLEKGMFSPRWSNKEHKCVTQHTCLCTCLRTCYTHATAASQPRGNNDCNGSARRIGYRLVGFGPGGTCRCSLSRHITATLRPTASSAGTLRCMLSIHACDACNIYRYL